MHDTIASMYIDIFPKKSWIKIGLLAGAFIFAYIPAISLLAGTWLSRDDSSHGFLVPFISLYFVWTKRERLSQIPIIPNISGGITIIVIASILLIMGSVSGVAIAQEMSILLVIPGIVLLLLGMPYIIALALPLTYLIFMSPILNVFLDKIRWPLQLFSAKFAGVILKYAGIPAYQYKNYIELPNITLEVADVCSGVNYLISIIAIAIPIAFLTQKAWQRKIVIISSAVSIGILANVARIILIGIWTTYNIGENSHGPNHIFRGLFVSVIGFVFLFIVAWVFAETSPLSVIKSNTEKRIATSGITINTQQFNKAWLIAIALLLSIGSYLFLYNPQPIPLKRNLKELPIAIGDWRLANTEYQKNLFEVQGADSEVIKVYKNASGREIKLYIGYFELQKQDKELINYRLQGLYNNAKEIEISADSYGQIKVNEAILQNASQNLIVLYWYNINGRIIADNRRAKVITAIDGLIYRQTNGAIIMVYSDLKHHDDQQKALKNEIEFTKEIIPVLQGYIP